MKTSTVIIIFLIFFLGIVLCGCGTTKWSDTSRTATEQLLLSYAIDHTVEQLNFQVLSGKKVFVSTTAIAAVTDNQYIGTAVRQHIASFGGLICDKQEDAEYIVELRAGAVGTDRNDVMVGIPAITVPVVTTSGTLPQIPEIPFVKKTDQRAVAKIAIFVYNKETGHPLWCSGNRQSESRAKAWWVFGAGPFNRGNIYDGTQFAGNRLSEMVPFPSGDTELELPPPLTAERHFLEPPKPEKTETAEALAATNADQPAGTPPAPTPELAEKGIPVPVLPPSPPPPPSQRLSTYGRRAPLDHK